MCDERPRSFAGQMRVFTDWLAQADEQEVKAFLQERFAAVSVGQRDQWLAQLVPEKSQPCETSIDAERLFTEALEALRTIQSAELYIEGSAYWDHSIHWDSEEEISYTSNERIKEIISQVASIAEQLVNAGHAKRAYELSLAILDCQFTVVIEESEELQELDYDTAAVERLVPLKTRAIKKRGQGYAFRGYTGHTCYEKIYDVLARFPDEQVDIEAVFYGKATPWQVADLFIAGWLDFLAERSDLAASNLLEDYASRHFNLMERQVFAIKHLVNHPVFAWETQKKLMAANAFEDAVYLASEVMEQLAETLTLRARIAELGAKASLAMQDLDSAGYFMCQAFISEPSAKRYLILRTQFAGGEASEWCQDAWASYLQIPLEPNESFSRGAYYWRNGILQCEQRQLDEQTDREIRFFRGELTEVMKRCGKVKALGWSQSLAGIVVPTLILLLQPDVPNSAGCELLAELAERLGWDDETIDFSAVFATFKMQMQSMPTWTEWLPDIEQFLKKQIARRTKALLENQRRRSYHKAAELIVAFALYLDTVQAGNGMKYIQYYESEYSRYSRFRAELREFS